jgi:hypothetical protein
MDAERLAFLDDIEADLATTKSASPVGHGSRPATTGRSGRSFRRIGLFGAGLAACASFLTLSATVANATTVGAATATPAVPYCGVPNPVPYSHTKSCGVGFYYHDFIYQYTGRLGQQCYDFWSHLSDLGCGSDPGHETFICK